MLIGSIYGWENGRDDIFNPQSPRNRDDCLEPMRQLNVLACQHDIELHTADVNTANNINPDFSLYVESVDFVTNRAQKNYLILYETPLTVPRNANVHYLNQFDVIFTWNKELLQNGLQDPSGVSISKDRFVRMQYPNPIPQECVKDFKSSSYEQRPDLVCLIGSNRHANAADARELYSSRVKAIKWFEANTTNEFKLYGNGWSVPQKRQGTLGKLRYRLEKIIPFLVGKPVFPSYQGPAPKKYSVLNKAKYCICFENARDIDGYITEKIFDCFFAGCIPIYWGDANISQVIPSQCFIDFRQFSSHDDLYRFIKAISPEQFLSYQNSARQFLMSNQFAPFSSRHFAEVIVQKIAQDFSRP